MFNSQQSLVAQLDAEVFDAQDACPLFCILPYEIRTEIFSLALLSYNDPACRYPLKAYYRRPGHTHHQLIATALLETCCRVYSETHDLVVAQNEHVFWERDKHGNPPTARSVNPHKYFQSMTPEQRAAVRCVHFFGRFDWINATHLPVLRALGVRPTLLRITYLYSNLKWIRGEMSARGVAEMIPTMPRGEFSLQGMNGLERLEVEVEAMSQHEALLQEVANAQFKRTFNLPTGRMLTTEGNEVTRVRYMTNVEAVPVFDNFPSCYSWRRRYYSGPAKFGFAVIRLVWTPTPRKGTPSGEVVRWNAKG